LTACGTLLCYFWACGHYPRRIAMPKKTFAKMTKSEKAIAIAKDVLKQLNARKYTATPGTYVYAKTSRKPPPAIGIADMKTCKVCALGACVVSAARLGGTRVFNEVIRVDPTSTGYEFASNDTFISLRKYFTEFEAEAMESAFERYKWNTGGTMFRFGTSAKDRLRRIMQNVIDNKGHFVVPAIP
jgi:hypothetical protein